MTLTQPDVAENFRLAEELLAQARTPRERAMLEDYLRHAVMEFIGRHREAIDSARTVPDVHYKFLVDGQYSEIDGIEAVLATYDMVMGNGAHVAVFEDTRMAVADWGLTTYAVWNQYLPGAFLAAGGAEVDDPAATYLVRVPAVLFFLYDEEGRFTGEQLFEVGPREVRKLDPSEVLTPEQAHEQVLPLARRLGLA